MTDRDSFIEKLQDVHDFPGPYVIKVIGPNSPEFASAVLQAIILVCGREASPDVSSRTSSKGNHLSLTVEFHAETPVVVLEVYDAIKGVESVKFVL